MVSQGTTAATPQADAAGVVERGGPAWASGSATAWNGRGGPSRC